MKRNNTLRCRNLRKNQTDTECKLWSVLRNRQLAGVKFRRQFCIDRYILDFYSPEYKLGIEADGGQHYEREGMRRDKTRDKELSKHGIRILRYSDLDILSNIDGVCEEICRVIEDIKNRPLTLILSPKGRGSNFPLEKDF